MAGTEKLRLGSQEELCRSTVIYISANEYWFPSMSGKLGVVRYRVEGDVNYVLMLFSTLGLVTCKQELSSIRA